MKTTVIDGQEVPVLDATSVETTYRHMKTGEVFKERKQEATLIDPENYLLLDLLSAV